MPLHLPQKELDILSLLLHAKTPMTISDIVATDTTYTTNIVQPIIRKFCNLGLIEVADIVYRKKSLTRAFRPTACAQTILQEMFFQEYNTFQKLFSENSLLASLLEFNLNSNSNAQEIERLEKILLDFKNRSDKE